MESITTNCLINLAFDLSNDWRELARVLDLSEEVPRICEDYRRNVSEQAYRMLKTWVGKKGSKATYQVLREALAHETVLRNDLVQKYCGGKIILSWNNIKHDSFSYIFLLQKKKEIETKNTRHLKRIRNYHQLILFYVWRTTRFYAKKLMDEWIKSQDCQYAACNISIYCFFWDMGIQKS